MTGAIENIRNMRRLANKPFVRRANESPSLQLIVLLLGWWVAVSLAWVGAPIWIWLGGALLLTAGHAFSWIFRDFRSPVRSGVVSVALVGTLALVPGAVIKAIGGDWMPVAYFLILFQAVASFEMRTRGGLYASIIISGAIFFFVSQQALDIVFVIFLTGFTTLLLSFLALSFLLDQVRNADVRWFQGRFSFTWFWTGVFVVSMLVSAAIFFMLPKQFADPINNAHGAVLPMRASDSIEVPDVNFGQQPMPSALPVTATTAQDMESAAADRDGLGSSSSGASGSSVEGGNAQRSGAAGSGNGNDDVQVQGTQASGGDRLPQGNADLEGSMSDRFAGDPLIMQIRSPVLSYWRDYAFDTFDGQTWHQDETAWFLRSRESARAVYTAPQPRRLRRGTLYNQTFFVKQPQSEHTILSGYAPLVASLPYADDGGPRLENGAVYRVVSSLPNFSVRRLRRADPSSRLEYRYHQLPPSMDGIQPLAVQITSGAFTDVDRMRRIVTYIDKNYEYDVNAADQLALTEDPMEYVRQQGLGTSMDIATATVMLARGAGIPARLVTGYLPGEFDPLSGTYMVRASHSHAWAEVYFQGSGWVPFDSAPRPAAAAFGEGGTFFNSPPVDALFSTDYSEDIYGRIRSSPQLITELLDGDVGRLASSAAGSVMVIAVLAFAALAAWRFAPMIGRNGNRLGYARLGGDGRAEVLQAYFDFERRLQRAGVPPREPYQTIAEYTQGVEASLGDSASDLRWLREAAWAAAYDPSPYDQGMAHNARRHIERLKITLKMKEKELRQQSSSHPEKDDKK